MAEKDAKPKKQSTIKQIIQIYKYTAKEDKALPWLEAGAVLLPVVVTIIIGLIVFSLVFAAIGFYFPAFKIFA